jgi:hypothetical protein
MFDNRLAIAKQFGTEVIDLRAGAPVPRSSRQTTGKAWT